MANILQLEIVTPDKLVVNAAVDRVTILAETGERAEAMDPKRARD